MSINTNPQPFICNETDLPMLQKGLVPKAQQATLQQQISKCTHAIVGCSVLLALFWVTTGQMPFVLIVANLLLLFGLCILRKGAADWLYGAILAEVGKVENLYVDRHANPANSYYVQLGHDRWRISPSQYGLLLGWGECEICIYYFSLSKRVAYIERLDQMDKTPILEQVRHMPKHKISLLKQMEKFPKLL